MSLQAISSELRRHNIDHVIVTAKTAKKFADLDSFKASLKDEALVEYADAYSKWLESGKEGKAPVADSEDYAGLKYVRMVVNQL